MMLSVRFSAMEEFMDDLERLRDDRGWIWSGLVWSGLAGLIETMLSD